MSTPSNQEQPKPKLTIPKGPRIEADADPRNRYWLIRAPLFPFRRLADEQQRLRQHMPKREE